MFWTSRPYFLIDGTSHGRAFRVCMTSSVVPSPCIAAGVPGWAIAASSQSSRISKPPSHSDHVSQNLLSLLSDAWSEPSTALRWSTGVASRRGLSCPMRDFGVATKDRVFASSGWTIAS
jgi:hypothetical protein